jgi:hypothetical protein
MEFRFGNLECGKRGKDRTAGKCEGEREKGQEDEKMGRWEGG